MLRKQPTPNYFLGRTPPVITFGKSGLPKHLLINEDQLQEKGVAFFKTNRGGDITFHGPGQLVGYPILDLENFFTDIHKYLASVGGDHYFDLKRFWFKGERSEARTGVWLGVGTPFPRKYAPWVLKPVVG